MDYQNMDIIYGLSHIFMLGIANLPLSPCRIGVISRGAAEFPGIPWENYYLRKPQT